jgi:hypothetical protein
VPQQRHRRDCLYRARPDVRMVSRKVARLYSGEGGVPRTGVLVVATILVLTCASCDQSDSPTTAPSSPSVRTTSPPTTTSPSSSPTVPPYLSGYPADERTAYDGAVRAYAAFSDREAKIFATGKATPAAKRFYVRYSGDWLTYWNQLRQRERDKLRIVGRGHTLRVRPVAINLGKDGSGTVELRVCGIARGVKAFQGSTEIPQPTPKPWLVRVKVIRLKGESRWRVFSERLGGPC